MNNIERILDLVREISKDCEVVNIYFQGFDSIDNLKPKYNYAFHREPVNAKPLEVKK